MKTKKQIRIALLAFIILLSISGITAFPLKTETEYLMSIRSLFPRALNNWINKVHESVWSTPEIVLYGTDWLAFAHLVIALFFIPVYRDPVKYKENILFAQVACIGVFFIAFICGAVRGIPFFHQVIDCSFGFVGFFCLGYIQRKIKAFGALRGYEIPGPH
jgi:hypothetical protein